MTADDITLREYIEAKLVDKDLRDQQRFDAQSSAISAALLAAEKAVVKAETAAEKRFESVNEFRQTLTDQAGTFVSKDEFNALKERVDKTEGKSTGRYDSWGILLGVVGLIALAVGILTK